MTSPITTSRGKISGSFNEATGVYSFKGIPFATPPVGDLRWKAPQPVQPWTDVRDATKFGPRAMQPSIFGDMNFRSDGMSEDCLYLNVWTPVWTPDPATNAQLPVLVYFYGGGFIAGDGSEPRYDGEHMARRGIVTLTVNYRLNVFGFMAHPELSAESPQQCSGNYAYLDQNAALRWVQENIAAFGGDPKRVTIAGESAGSISVNAQMLSPLSKGLIAGAIGSSGGVGALPPKPLAEVEQLWVSFADKVGANSIADLRAIPADKLLKATKGMGADAFPGTIDGYFFPKPSAEIFAAEEQAQVPLMVGWNSQEQSYQAVLGKRRPTPRNYRKMIQDLYGDHANDILRLYPGATRQQVIQSATDLASDRFTVPSTWQWADSHRGTGCPVFRYYYPHPRPAMVPEMGDAEAGLAGGIISKPKRRRLFRKRRAPQATGAVHSADIEYAMGNLTTNRAYAWTEEDEQLSEMMQSYYANFVKTGNPNGRDLPAWPQANDTEEMQYLVWDVQPQVKVDQHRARYVFLDKLSKE